MTKKNTAPGALDLAIFAPAVAPRRRARATLRVARRAGHTHERGVAGPRPDLSCCPRASPCLHHEARFLPKIIAAMAGAALLASSVYADEMIQHVNNQEALIIGVAPLQTTEQALSAQGLAFVNHESGTRVLFGFDQARTRTLFGIPDLYTDLEVSLGFATLAYEGNSINQTSGAASQINQPTSYAQEAIRIRVGRSYEFFEGNRVALTPFFGVSQQAWGRDTSDVGIADGYDHVAYEIGGLVQVSLPYKLVLGADASVGRTLGAVLFGHTFGNLTYASASSFALKLDHRTFASWHQRLEIRQSYLRYGQPAGDAGFFEPRRSSDLAIMLEFGTEDSIF